MYIHNCWFKSFSTTSKKASIWYASYYGYTDIVHYLLQSNADPNIPDDISVLLY